VFFFPITGLPVNSIPYFVVPDTLTRGGDRGFDDPDSGVGVELDVGVGMGVLTTGVVVAVGDSVPFGVDVAVGVGVDVGVEDCVLFGVGSSEVL
jgi:hypothetical protein